MTKFSIALHGGAGTIRKASLTEDAAAGYHAALRDALEAGAAVLRADGTALDAVTAAVMALEDAPLFNAGRGAVFNSDGVQEMDAAIMDGRDRRAGAVAGIFGPRNPILAARAVMERSAHVMMIGEGALKLAREAGLTFADPDHFFTEARWKALQDTLRMRATGAEDDDPARRHGTVGAVARDRAGNLAAATSTGGMTAKTPGRVGDTPIIGSGTFADNATCAVSGTGHGEVFIRFAAAHEIAARIRHAGQSLADAADWVVMQDLAKNDGSGGLVAVDAQGRVALPFNCEGMYRAAIEHEGPAMTRIHDA
ncbi:isoaspartyl peptidase/L-asparaginase [Pararhodobacter sp. SW119]|uniref:isoaspartyl peptidase/L-asparaginase family protein n=1 Tax=Pararhodobacter sp. SW119 TaxID=2780075 RepID=UPI001AE0AB2A|nr:isoaspartyl peptidase/L-asparaginase [Pararhodobacter sp. SW119]